MEQTVYVAVVQEPMAALDDATYVKVFTDRDDADEWVDSFLANNYGHPGEIPICDMNWCVYEKKVHENLLTAPRERV